MPRQHHHLFCQPRLFSPLLTFVGQTRSRALIARLAAAGIGECVTRGRLPPRRTPWFYDCGAFEDHQARRPFNYAQYVRDIRAIRLWHSGGNGRGILEGQPMSLPHFILLPDLVEQGDASLAFSLDHLAETELSGVPCYLAVQDGMNPSTINRVLHQHPTIEGLFVGGSLKWKLRTAATWCALGRHLGRPVHIGRVGTVARIRWAETIGATSVDSSFPLWQKDRLTNFMSAIA